jgi:hypothetical protein
MQNVNTVDVIMPAWPIFLYTNITLGKYLLLGLLEYQATGQYLMLGLPTILVRLLQKCPSFSDSPSYESGSSYPNATGHNAGND